MRWLSVEAHLLAGRYHGRSHGGREAQWPPNPHRVLQALVAAGNLGYRRIEFSDRKRDALRWLERKPAPEIVTSPARQANSFRLYVPNNDMDKVARDWARGREPEKEPNQLRTDKDLRPHSVEDPATVRFLWPIPDEDWPAARAHAELLADEARHLHSLGLGIDLVAGSGRILTDTEKKALPGEVLVADDDGAGWWVPVAGSLDELIHRHELSLTARVPTGNGGTRGVFAPVPPAMVREVAYVPRPRSRERAVHAFALLDESGGFRSFDPCLTIVVAAWMRHAVHHRARGMKLDRDFVERFVCGHGDTDAAKRHRFSYLPLPTIPANGRDGRIRRVLIAEPFGGGGKHAAALIRRLSGASLVNEDTGEAMAEANLLSSPRREPVAQRYVHSSQQWGSVTPVVLPGHDDGRSRKAYGLVLKALAQAGYTMPVSEIQIQREPVFPGAELACRYRMPAYLRSFPRVHAVIAFAEPVVGPIVIGAGRHIGLGLFAGL